MANNFLDNILKFNTPGILSLIMSVLKIINNFHLYFKSKNKNENENENKNENKNEIKNINELIIKTIKNIISSIIYIFILNYLCNKNLCWASWILLFSQIIFIIITLLFVFSIINILM